MIPIKQSSKACRYAVVCMAWLTVLAGMSVAGAGVIGIRHGGTLPQTASVHLVSDVTKVPRTHGPISREIVSFASSERPGTIIISNADRTLHQVLGNGQAVRYKISVGRDGFTWTGTTFVGRKAEWPDWRPPAAMLQRQPTLPSYVPPGPYNPLGARALYLHPNGKDTLYRIHGTNNAASVGGYETSGCFRLSNADVMELFKNVKPGTKVIVK